MTLSLWETLRDAFLWCLEGLYGAIVAGTHFYTEVPWYQCLLGSLAFVVPMFLLQLFVLRQASRETSDEAVQEEVPNRRLTIKQESSFHRDWNERFVPNQVRRFFSFLRTSRPEERFEV